MVEWEDENGQDRVEGRVMVVQKELLKLMDIYEGGGHVASAANSGKVKAALN